MDNILRPLPPVMEIDGPPWFDFEISSEHFIVKRVYRTLRAPSDEKLQDNIDRLRAECARVGAFLIWRYHPRPGDPYCRVITSLPLPDEFWQTIGWDQTGTGYTPP